MDALKLLVDQQIREGIAARNEAKLRSDEANRRHAESQQKVADLLEEVARLRVAAPVDAAAAPVLGDAAAARAAAAVVARAEKISKMQVNLRKSNKIKEYKESTETTVKEWLSKFDTDRFL